MKFSRALVTAVAVAGLVGAPLAVSSATATAASVPVPTPTPYSSTIGGTAVKTSSPVSTPAQLTTFELSSTPKVIVVDRDTAAVTSVTEVSAKTTVKPLGISNPCAVGAVCWETERVPYADWGFSPRGTYSGTWNYRGTFSTHNYTGKGYYRLYSHPSTLLATPTVGPNSVISFTGSSCYGVTVVVS